MVKARREETAAFEGEVEAAEPVLVAVPVPVSVPVSVPVVVKEPTPVTGVAEEAASELVTLKKLFGLSYSTKVNKLTRIGYWRLYQ